VLDVRLAGQAKCLSPLFILGYREGVVEFFTDNTNFLYIGVGLDLRHREFESSARSLPRTSFLPRTRSRRSQGRPLRRRSLGRPLRRRSRGNFF
jgi:hypothetical protein